MSEEEELNEEELLMEKFRKHVIKNKFDTIVDDLGIDLLKIIKRTIKYSTIDISKYDTTEFNYYNTEKLKELYTDVIMNATNRKNLIKNIISPDYDGTDHYLNVIADGKFKLCELKLLLVDFNNDKKTLTETIEKKIKNYNLDTKHYIVCDLNDVVGDKLKIILYVINHNICHEPLVFNK
jgi:hypothetical protein